MNDQAKYTVLFDDEGFQHNDEDQCEFSGVGLDDLICIAAARWPRCIPVAWAPEWPHGKRGVADLLAESIAAGRLIELVDGKYVARGVEEGEGLGISMTPTQDKLEAEAKSRRFDALDNDLIANDEGLYCRLIEMRGGCRCFTGCAPCSACCEPLTQAEADRLGLLDGDDDPNAAMIARDGPARVKPAAAVTPAPCPSHGKCTYPDCGHFLEVTAKPSPFASFRSPDLCACTHQIDPAHQLKG